jgi:tripartite-type tricarboxylate transporter receptor subunit TctC
MRVLHVMALSFLWTLFGTAISGAEGYPVRTVQIVVPSPAGGAPDLLARLLSKAFQERFGQTFVVENKPGALGVLGTSEVARSEPDGYTLLLTTNTQQAANVALVKNLPYDPVEDFAPIARAVTVSMVLVVRPEFPAETVQGFIEHARSKPEGLSGGYGSAVSQVSLARLKSAAGTDLVAIPYKGIPPAVNDLLGGHIDFTFSDLSVVLPLLRSGRLKALGTTSGKRLAALPELPSISEDIPGFEVTGWIGLVAPAGTQREIVTKLSKATFDALSDPQIREKLVSISYGIEPLDSDEFSEFIKAEISKWSRDAKEAGILPQ